MHCVTWYRHKSQPRSHTYSTSRFTYIQSMKYDTCSGSMKHAVPVSLVSCIPAFSRKHFPNANELFNSW